MIETQSEESIREMFAEFSEKNNGLLPEYAHCTIEFLDDHSSTDVIIRLSQTVDEKDDDLVFFYCRGCNDIISLTEPGIEDFIVKQVNELSYDI